MKAKMSILAVVLLLGAAPTFADVLPKTYAFDPVAKSLPTMGDYVDEICQIGNSQAWFGFDISSIPDEEQIISASFKVLMADYTGSPTRRTLWYDPYDDWIDTGTDPENRVLSEQVGIVKHKDDIWTWITFDIDISKHDWSNDLADNYVTLMLTGPPDGVHADGAVDLRGAVLTLKTVSAPGDIDERGILLNLGPEELVQANGVDIRVAGYSVPSFVDWNNDKLKDLVIGEGGGSGDAKVRVYLNVGTESEPEFSDYFYAQSNGSDLVCSASGCMGCFPRVEYWDADERKDLLVGQADGTVKIFLNIGTDSDPFFDAGQLITVGSDGENLDVGARATPCLVDWDSDGRKDLVVGALDGRIHIFLNCGCGGGIPPSFKYSSPSGIFAREDGSDLVIPSSRSSPVILDVDGDGKKYLLSGNTDGQLLFYCNIGTNKEPCFSDCTLVESNGVPIDLPGSPRSRPFLCYWTGDGHFGPMDTFPDVLIGASDGKVHLFRGLPKSNDIDGNGNVALEDLTLFVSYWLQKDNEADFNSDGQVDEDDLYSFIEVWLLALEEQPQD